MKKILLVSLLAFSLNGFAQSVSVAVLPSDGDAKLFDNDDLEALTSKMRSVALKTLPRETFTLLTQDVVVKRLGGAENFIKACRESSCIVDLGKKAQVDYVAQASIGKLRDKMRLKVEVYSVSTSGLVGMYDGDGKYFDDYFDLLDAIEENVPDIFKKIPEAASSQPLPPPKPSLLPIQPAPVAPPAQKYVPSEYVPPEISYKPNPLMIQSLIKKDLKKNKEVIKKESLLLPIADREFLYEEYKKNWSVGWALLNYCGTGVGSYLQGDIKGGAIQTILFVPGIVVLSISNGSHNYEWVGFVLLGNMIWGYTAPYLYKRGYNKDLREALNIDDVSFSIDPLIIPKDGPPAVGLAFNLRY